MFYFYISILWYYIHICTFDFNKKSKKIHANIYSRNTQKNEVRVFLFMAKTKHLSFARLFRLHLTALRDRHVFFSPFRKCNEISVTPIARLYLNIIRIGNSREPTTALYAAPLSSTPLAVKSRLELLSRRIADDPWPLLVAYWRYIACLSPVEHLLSARKSRVLLIFVDR